MVKTSKLVVASNKRIRKHKRVLKGYKNHFCDTTIELVYKKLVGLGSEGQLEKTCDILDFAQHDATGNPYKVGDYFMTYVGSCARGFLIQRISRVVRVTKKTCIIRGFEGYMSYAGNRYYEDRPYRITRSKWDRIGSYSLWYEKRNSMLFRCPEAMVLKVKELGDNIIGKEDFLVKGSYKLNTHIFEMMYRCNCWGYKK